MSLPKFEAAKIVAEIFAERRIVLQKIVIDKMARAILVLGEGHFIEGGGPPW